MELRYRFTSPPVEDDIPVRNGLRAKMLYFWRTTCDDLFEILSLAEGLETILGLAAINEARYLAERHDESVINLQPTHDVQLVIAEVMDDYWASYLCFLNGFTKQSQQILRNTVELVLQASYLQHRNGATSASRDAWTDGYRGIERIPDKIETLASWLESIQPGLSSRVRNLYNLLCMSTHSHKSRMTALRMPRMMTAGDMPSMEPTEVLYSRSLLLAVMDLEIRILETLLSTWTDDVWRTQVRVVLESMLHSISKYKRLIANFHKGYLIHREHAMLTGGTQIVYSIKLDGSAEVPGRKRMLTAGQAREFRDKVELRLLEDRV